MNSALATVEISQDVLTRIDDAVGTEERTAFLNQAADAALQNRKLKAFLDGMEKNGPAWKEEDHPELAEGVYAWVRKMRAERETRMQAVEEAWRAE